MLLSHPSVARLIGDRFEPAWQSVRDVPQLTLDFGSGVVVRRTLHGNIATYVCAPDGAVLDVVPGLYDAPTFTGRLEDGLALAASYAKWPLRDRAQLLRAHHAAPRPVLSRADAARLLSKSRIERPVEEAVAAQPQPAEPAKDVKVVDSKMTIERPVEKSVAAVFVAPDGTRVDTAVLARDVRHNEEVRRPLIAAMLAEEGVHTPESLTKRIYREVLDADLDDPYLGLGDALFATYPFRR